MNVSTPQSKSLVTAIPDVPLPKVPEELVKELIDFFEDPTIPFDQRIPLDKVSFDIKEKNDKWTAWVSENITTDFLRASIQCYTGDLPAHIDQVRNFSLLYLVRAGGENVETRFYNCLPHAMDPYKKMFRFRDVEEVSRYQFKEGTWNLINNKYIHAVKGCHSNRISLAIDFLDKDVPECVKLLT